MRLGYLFFVLCFITLTTRTSFGDTVDNSPANVVQDQGILMELSDVKERLNPIKRYIATQDPEFAQTLDQMSTDAQISTIRSWLAEQSFRYYYEYYMDMMRAESEKTKREIMTHSIIIDMWNGATQYDYWLNRGELEDEDKCYNLLERRACDFPDGFTEFHISYCPDCQIRTLTVSFDRPDENKSYFIDLSLSVNGEYDVTASNDSQQFILAAYKHIEKYDEVMKYRNQDVADIRAGKYIRDAETGRIVMDTSKEWESQNLPGARIDGRVYMWSLSEY